MYINQKFPFLLQSQSDEFTQQSQHGEQAGAADLLKRPHGGAQLPGGEEDWVRELWGASARKKPLQQRARCHQARANEVQGASVTLGVQVRKSISKL